MARIRREITIEAAPAAIWDAVHDVGALHTRLVPGFVTDTKLEPGERIVTFGNGMVVRELIVDLDDAARRLVWSVRGGGLAHHNASLEVTDAGVVWTADVLPDDLAPRIAAMMEQGLAVMKRTLEA
jgi:hypothetical protein